MKPTNFARYMSRYLIEFLPGVKGVSYNTIASKRDTYMLLLKYFVLENLLYLQIKASLSY